MYNDDFSGNLPFSIVCQLDISEIKQSLFEV